MAAHNAQESGARSRAKVFLSYADADPNVDVVHSVYCALAGEHDVYYDRSVAPGERWSTEIEAKIAGVCAGRCSKIFSTGRTVG